MTTIESLLTDPHFEHFISDARILIVDSNFTYRIALKQSLLFFGANEDKIRITKNLSQAQALMMTFQPQIIFSDFLLEDGIGTHLMKDNKGKTIFILVSSVNTQAAVANAAEMEVDQFIFKPYSQSQLRDILKNAANKMQSRTKSDQCIEDGKELISIGEIEKAAALFENAKDDPLAYARACSYLGEIRQIMDELKGATKSFRDGLNYCEINFRCLNGLFHSLLKSGRVDESYEIIKKIVVHFPECPDRLIQALNLAVRTNHFDDIEEFYLLFQFCLLFLIQFY